MSLYISLMCLESMCHKLEKEVNHFSNAFSFHNNNFSTTSVYC